jgi:hypothetical protein
VEIEKQKMRIVLAFMLFCAFQFLHAQNKIDASRIIDELVGIQDDDADYEMIYENLMQLLAHPADLNLVSPEELRQYHLLSDIQINEFIKYRDENGKLLSIYELQAIPAFDKETIEKILPFMEVLDQGQQVNRSFLKKIAEEGNHYCIARWDRTMEEKEGFAGTTDSTRRYQGVPDKVYLRFRSSLPGEFSFGFTAENDAGEVLKWNPGKQKFGADYLSTHLQVLNKGVIKNLIIGDFQSQFGQGLIYGGAFGLGKGAETITTARKNSIGFVPHTSAAESGFFHGAGTTLQFSKIFLSALYSETSRDGTLEIDQNGMTGIRSLQYSGFHRNETEIFNKRRVGERLYGGVLEFRNKTMSAGVLAQHIEFAYPIVKDTSIYNQFAFRGNQNTNVGIHVTAAVNNFNFFGEGARSLLGGYAFVTGLIVALDPKLDVAMVVRKFDPNYFPFYANPFSENTQPINEQGFYIGWKYRWNKKYNVAGYVDLFKFPWLSFRRYQPTTGHEWLVRFNYQPSKKIIAFLQAREESKMRNTADENVNHIIATGVKRNYWLSLNYSTEQNLNFRSRIQYSTYRFQKSTTDGIVLLQSISYTIGKLQLSAYYAIFESDNFDNRQYVYENDVQLAFSLPAYDGKGLRNYFMLEYKITKAMAIWIRYARTRFTDRDEIGTGLETIHGNTRNDVKFQTILKF